MKKINWTEVKASNGSNAGLPSGAYVMKCIAAKDYPDNEYIEIVWDVAEGEHAGHYSDEWGMQHEWMHSFKVSYKERAMGLFKHFLECIELSNPSFNITKWQESANESDFVGKVFGAAIGKEQYTYNGKDYSRWTFPYYYAADQIRLGGVNIPKDVDNRESAKSASAPATPMNYDDLPFV